LPFAVCIDSSSCKILMLNYTPKATAVCRFTVASNRFYKQEEVQEAASY
jgi:single-stranded DNA-binding protein